MMWQYFFLTLRRKPGQSLLAASGFLLVACTLILLSATTLTTVLRTKQIISQNWRLAYDLVVLPLPLPLRNVWRSRGRALIALGCLFLSALLLVVLVAAS